MNNKSVCLQRVCIAWLFSVLLVQLARAAPPKLDTLFPAGAMRGQEVLVDAGGSFSSWPVDTWHNRPGLQIAAAEDKGKLKIVVAPHADCGVFWIRLHSKEGASALRPFFVDTLPEVTEQEPNNAIEQSHPLSGSTNVNGRLEKRGDVDGFAIELAAGQQLVAALQANSTLGSPMDGVLQICNPQGFVMKQNDDSHGLDPLLTFVAPQNGNYVVRTFAFPATADSSIRFSGGRSYIYRLTITTGGYLDQTLPLAVPRGQSCDLQLLGWNVPPHATQLAIPADADAESVEVYHPQLASALLLPRVDGASLVAEESSSPEAPQRIDVPCTVSGQIEVVGDQDVFEFAAVKGQKLVFRAEADSLGYLLDPLLVLTDSDGKNLSEVDDTNRKRDAVLRASVPADGQYRLLIRDVHRHGGPRYAYRLTARTETPDYSLTLAADAYTVTSGKPLEIPVTIERQDGFAGEIEIMAQGLPTGVTAKPVKSLAKGASAKAVKLVVQGGKVPSSTAFRIVGAAGGDTVIKRNASYVLGATSRRGHDVWLTVVKLH